MYTRFAELTISLLHPTVSFPFAKTGSFMTHHFGTREQLAAQTLVNLALAEDLGYESGQMPDSPQELLARDLTCAALIDSQITGVVEVVARQPGVLAGVGIGEIVFQSLSPEIRWKPHLQDGSQLEAGSVIATATGPLAALLVGERTMLNFMSRLSGIASLTQRYVLAVSGTNARVLDTRKTLPGYRLLEKYAVTCGGGHNHRLGLYDGVLIKDNHLAAWTRGASIAAAIAAARQHHGPEIPIEVEVDTLDQLRDAISGNPEIVLLDNMTVDMLQSAVTLRNSLAPNVLLEASGGVTLQTIGRIAQTGVERISVGAITHSAISLDLGFDWVEC